MRKTLGLFVVLMLLSWSVAMVHPVKATPTTAENTAYEAFWNILHREAELYAQVENGNSSALGEFISNSRLGAENAINISTLIWGSIEELKASGVKLYYTADELRQMAENISKNGLPNETVEELKAQGWTDDQIKALEDYIAKNADNITGDFNMSAFLQNFSTAFMRVAFKYNHYWAYGFEKLLNQNASSLDVPAVVITQSPEARNVPIVWDAFENFTNLYKNADLATKLSLVRKLEDGIINMGHDAGWETLYSKKNFLTGGSTSCQLIEDPTLLRNLFRNASITSKRLLNRTYSVPIGSLPAGSTGYYYETLAVRSFVSGGYIIVELRRKWESQKVLDDCSIQTASGENYTIYYWRAFQALEALKDLEFLLEAMEKGNGNPNLKKLEANLTRSLPELFKTNKIGYYGRSSTTIIHRLIPGDPQPRAIEGTSSSDASLNLGVEVSAADVTEDYATYKVTVALQAVGGSVSDVEVSVNGDGLSDSTHYNLVSEDDGVVRWTTKESSKIYGSGSVNVSGTVDVYYSIPHATPASTGLPKDAGTGDSGDRKHISKEYSETIRLGTPIEPGKVTFKIIPSDSVVRPGSNVTFKVQVINNNDRPINAEYTLYVAYPIDGGSATASFSNSSIVQKGDPWVDMAGRVHYASTGTFHYSGVLKFDGFSKNAEGDIVVSSNANSSGSDPAPSNGSLKIVRVTPEPAHPKEDDTVGFNVKIGNRYPSTQRALVKLYVDGKLKDSKPVNVTTSGASVTLHWLAQAGEHEWMVELWRIDVSKSVTGIASGYNNLLSDSKDMSSDERDGGDGALEDKDNGTIYVGDYPYVGHLRVSPSVIYQGQKVNFTVTLKNKIYHGSNGITIFVKDENGNILFDDYFYFNETNQQKTKTYHPVISSVGTHKYTLYVKTYPEYPLNTVSLEVRGSGHFLEQVSFSCTDMYFNYHWSRLRYEAPLSCTAVVENPTNKRIIIDSVEIVNVSFPFSSSWTIEYPSRIDGNNAGDVVFKTTVTSGELKVLLWWRTDVWIDLIYKISGLQEGANEDTTMVYHARYTQIQVDADKKDIVADSFVNLIGICSEYYEVKGLTTIALNGLKDSKDALAVLNGIVQFGKWVLGKLEGG